ncbi:MAG: heavy metal translocating P-type ATPase [Candidatus Thorarchaeota archaeon]
MSVENSHVCSHCEAERQSREKASFRIKYILATISAVSLILGFVSSLYGYPQLVYYTAYFIALISSGRWIIPNGIRSILSLHLGISFLMTVAATGAFLIGEPAEGAAVMFLFYIAELLEEKAGDRVRTEIQSLMILEAPSVSVKVGDLESCMHPEDVSIGQIIMIRPGEKVGLDGEVILGTSAVNQAPITGESRPVHKTIGDEVFAGTMNLDGYLEVKVTKESKDTVLSRIIDLVQEARKSKSHTENLVARFSHVYTPIVVTGALIMVVLTLLLGSPLHDAIYKGLTLLVISCPCAFAISIPVSMVSSIAGSAREGVLIKGSDYIEKLSKTKTVAFDKTGTLTQGELSLENICLHSEATRDDILAAAVALEMMSEHPIAAALRETAINEELKISEAREFLSIPGQGVIGYIGDSKYIVGNRKLLISNNIELPQQDHECGNGTVVFVVKDGVHLGTIILGDAIREGTKEALRELDQLGIKTTMLTGDNRDIAMTIAHELGFSQVEAELLPEDKVLHVQMMSAKGPTVMVGDGVNDTPALASADVGIAMGVISSDAAIETADVALMEEDLRKIPRLIARAKKTMRVIRQNVTISIGAKVLIGILAILGYVSLWMAIAFGDMGLTLFVIANALRLTRKKSN